MAAANPITLSSSPPRTFVTFNLSSSPKLLPSPDVSNMNLPVLRVGSHSTPIPQSVLASFTTAATLLKLPSTLNASAIESIDLPIEGEPAQGNAKDKNNDIKQRASKARQKSSKEEEIVDNVKPTKPRKSRAKAGQSTKHDPSTAKTATAKKLQAKMLVDKQEVKSELDEKVTKATKPRKPRAKKTNGETQTKIAKGRVIKSTASKEHKLPTSLEATEEHFMDSHFGLNEAVKRRTDWTPPTVKNKIILDSPARIQGEMDLDLEQENKIKGFGDLLRSFGFTESQSARGAGATVSDGIGTRKRKLIELVKTNISATASTNSTSVKSKAPKKKARTITGQATSAYVEEEDSTQAAPILQYFSCQAATGIDNTKAPKKSRSKSPTKSITKSKRGSTVQAPILLSPGSALKQVGEQDFLFGTSSQLAREESPTFLREIHQAMQASNGFEDDPFADKEPPHALPKKTLWSAGARGSTGELIQIETIDIIDSPVVTKPSKTRSSNDEAETLSNITNQPAAHVTPTKPSPVSVTLRAELLSSPMLSGKSPKLPKPQRLVELPKRGQKATKSGSTQKPDYNAYTTAQLAKEIASYHFKPVKNRDQMIMLLEKCWEGKNRIALGVLGINTKPQYSSPTKPSNTTPTQVDPKPRKRPRARLRKDSSSSIIAPLARLATATNRERSDLSQTKPLDEISDSEGTMTPSPPRRRGSQVWSPPLKLSTSSEGTEATSSLEPLSAYITRAIKSASPCRDPSKPSWQEKILLYDPIILEDLTAWLNTGGLEKVGWDGEVMPKEVKKWCEKTVFVAGSSLPDDEVLNVSLLLRYGI
ncbi:hypothetical protein BGZ60DRAFT_512569 [Tricladium varicosporioides]|nr:hypothetical protein BGZ60DRAFT_512569 [Hymenoscyphus varicosporioides]